MEVFHLDKTDCSLLTSKETMKMEHGKLITLKKLQSNLLNKERELSRCPKLTASQDKNGR